jgi:hypothetical protein
MGRSDMPVDIDTELLARIQTAPVVVVGHVSAIRQVESAASGARTGPARISEHDPGMAEAIIDVAEEIKGKPTGKQVVVRFPTSTDVMWYRYPKLEVGHSGVFILQPDALTPKTSALSGATEPTFNLAKKGDVLPVNEVARVRAAVKQAVGK